MSGSPCRNRASMIAHPRHGRVNAARRDADSAAIGRSRASPDHDPAVSSPFPRFRRMPVPFAAKAPLFSRHDFTPAPAMSSFLFVARHVFAWCVFYVLLLMVWSGASEPAGIPDRAAVDADPGVRDPRRGLAHPPRAPDRRRRRRRSTCATASAARSRCRSRPARPSTWSMPRMRELPDADDIETARDSLQVRAKRRAASILTAATHGRFDPLHWIDSKLGGQRNQIAGDGDCPTATPRSVTLVCEPESAAWSDWFRVDDGTNLENAEAITRAITRRVAEHRRGETGRRAARPRPRRNSPSPSSACCTRRSSRTSSTTPWPARR